MAINSVLQTIRNAEIDARSLSEFIYNPADAMVSRRLAPSIHTLNYYLRFFDGAVSSATADAKEIERQLLAAQQQALGTVSYIESTIRDAIDTTVIENSPVSDALVSVDGSLSQRTINKGLESIADLSTIKNPKNGLRVYIKSYHAGLGKGGGYFVYDSSKAGVNDGGTVINGWVRQPELYIDMHAFGGDYYDGDPMKACQLAVDFILDGGVVSLDGFTGVKEFDYSLVISKPVTILGNKDNLTLKLADQSSLFHTPARSQVILITSSNVALKSLHLDSNNTNNYVTYNGINYYFLESPELIAPELPESQRKAIFRYLDTILVKGAVSDVTIEGNILDNNSVHAIGVNGGLPSPWSKPDLSNPNNYARNITIRDNSFNTGCRSGVYFVAGVINSSMINNTAVNWGWAAFRFYFSTNNCVMKGNSVYADIGSDATKYESSEDILPVLAWDGYRVGHSSRGVGTCDNSTISNNIYEATGQRGGQDSIVPKAFRTSIVSGSVLVLNNSFKAIISTLPEVVEAKDIRVDVFISLNNLDGVRFQGNNITTNIRTVLDVLHTGSELPLSPTEITDNTFVMTGEDKANASLVFHSYDVSNPDVNIYIANNVVEGFSNLVWTSLRPKCRMFIKDNTISYVYTPVKSIGGVVFSMADVLTVSGNTINMTGSAANHYAIQGTSISKGVYANNTIIVNVNHSIEHVISSPSKDSRIQNNTIIKVTE